MTRTTTETDYRTDMFELRKISDRLPSRVIVQLVETRSRITYHDDGTETVSDRETRRVAVWTYTPRETT